MKKEIVFITSFPWLSLYQRPHHFARMFKKNGFGVQAVECRHLVRLNSLLNRMEFREHRLDIDGLWSVIKFPFVPLENIQLAGIIKKIVSEIEERGTEPVFWFQGINDAIDYDRILASVHGVTILDVPDSLPDFFTDPKKKRRLESAERSVAEKVDIVLTTAEILYEKFKSFNPRTGLVKNGVDLARYQNILPPPDPALVQKLDSIRQPVIIGYQGFISSWLDYDLVEHILRKHPDYAFLFVGMVDVRIRKEFQRLTRHPNFFDFGAVSPDVLPWILSKIDVGIIPFKINNLIRATNPIKLYEYLAAGKPVVATSMPEVMRYAKRGVVATAGDPEAFGISLGQMIGLSADASVREARLSLARANDWEARCREILDLVPELLPRKND